MKPSRVSKIPRRTRMVNHKAAAFIENKRYREEQHLIADVVNQNADSVYQTEAI